MRKYTVGNRQSAQYDEYRRVVGFMVTCGKIGMKNGLGVYWSFTTIWNQLGKLWRHNGISK